MKTILFLLWNIMISIKQVGIKLFDTVTACLVLISSFEGHMRMKQTAAALPNRQMQIYDKPLPFLSLQKDSQNRPHTKWQIRYEHHKFLFRSSA
ncbi:hypothetical protein [Paenibacillus arenilitoris]|uniref:Uncharacterized protein n=1 Tax=Paenibacillus arenilitoris TaxID=2772299 RepID=A0A927H6B4_9BACL|nr:hypothetical protein [Paenibacillus arenilitoris]MBD2870376.1 hypothetical protein [Paenibacillus arenilitoris]